VLDPACGSGNFLYVAYRELRIIEASLRRRAEDMRRSAGLRRQEAMALYFPLENIRGIERDQFAVQLARLSLVMGHKLAVDELDLSERVLPLPDLSGIQHADALRIEWPRADAIVGNPPYHGSQQIRSELGDDYAEWLRSEFGIGLRTTPSTGSARRTSGSPTATAPAWWQRTPSPRTARAGRAWSG
jgi:type I restriction-modification system DNA methylase subunit